MVCLNRKKRKLTRLFSALISLSTIGFGDMVPMVEPPLMYADAVRNESGEFTLIQSIYSTESQMF